MESISAYLLCVENGKEPTKELMSHILNAADSNYSKDQLELFMSKIEGKSFEEILKLGSEKMASQMPTVASSAQNEKKEEVKNEAPAEEESDEADLDFF